MTDYRITPDDAGTWLDGAHGWHNTYRVVDRAEEYGFTIPEDYRPAMADYRENGLRASGDSQYAVQDQGGLVDQATDYLQSLAPAGYVFVWDAGQLSLMPDSDADSL